VRLVTPPHTAMNLRHCLAGIENIDDNITTRLFISCSSQSPMDDAGHVSILGYPGPGCSPNEPMALVAMTYSPHMPFGRLVSVLSQREVVEQADADRLPSRIPSELRHSKRYQELLHILIALTINLVYYQIYKKHGAVTSKQPASSDDAYIGRISVDAVPPPHTATSIMRCISKIETLEMSAQSQLFTSISSKSPIGEGHVSILTSDPSRPGCTAEDPMAFVVLPVKLPVPVAAGPVVRPAMVPKFGNFGLVREALRTSNVNRLVRRR
jgi:hypothetical protein